MYSLSKSQSRNLYLPWLQTVVDYGDPVEVRGHQTKELLNCVSEILEPWHHCILMPSRRWNPFLAISEALWILAGRNDVAALSPYNSHIADYSDDGNTLYGAYGHRIYDKIDPLIERLRKDPSDRRAVLQIWDDRAKYGRPAGNPYPEDLTTNSKDPPCNNMVYFKLRDNKLHMTVINRSNDLHFGLMAVNLPTFGILQSYIAARLGVEMGTQTHFSNSLHVYTDEPRAAAITDRMLYTESEDMPVYPPHELAFKPNDYFTDFDHPSLANVFSAVLDDLQLGEGWDKTVPFLSFAQTYLRQYREHKWVIEEIPHNAKFFDWILAAELFLSKVWGKSYAGK